MKHEHEHNHHHDEHKHHNHKGSGTYHCPMNCEGDKNYTQPGNCPKCGMDLLEQPTLSSTSSQFTCPMHPEIIRDEPGSCPKCGMDLVPLSPQEDEEDKTYKELLKKMKIAVSFSVPVFIISMADLIPGKPLTNMLSQESWNIIQFFLTLPVVFYACWMFFVRAYNSVRTWNLNMFTLIGLGTGVAFIFSVFGMLFPDIFPNEFKTESGT
ncbi:MAG: ATPase, partial [Epsilonproteobacteria bacterium]|nr:ATPase [Campylobacterota bacterium]